jgi:multidrug efflux pump subunit AcrA (membrane-fusion protein)
MMMTVWALPVVAHEGHDHGFPGGGAGVATGPVTLTAAQIATLGITTQEAVFGEIAQTYSMPAIVELAPERRVHVSPLVSGQITRWFVAPGQKVKRGEPVVQIEPVAVGGRLLTLPSPIDGTVETMPVSIGQTVEVGVSVATIVDPSSLMVRGVALESPVLMQLKNGLPATFVADVAPAKSHTAAIERLLLSRQPTDAAFAVYAALEHNDGGLVPGMTGRLHVTLGDATPAVLVPARSILGEIADRFVFVRSGDTFERRAVVAGQRAGESIEIIDGVLPGDLVVTQGHYQLQFAAVTTAAADDGHEHDH